MKRIYPVDAVEWIGRNMPSGQMFNDYHWGGYLLWTLPEYPVFVDGRTDLYDDELLKEYIHVINGEQGWEQVINAYQINFIIIPKDTGLARELSLPVLVHDRAPEMEILDLLEHSGNINTGIAIHGFSKNIDYARRCIDDGIYLSIGLRTIQTSEPSFVKAVKETPLEYLLTETDSNKPEGVLTVCRLIAQLKETTMEEVGRVTTENLMRLCGI